MESSFDIAAAGTKWSRVLTSFPHLLCFVLLLLFGLFAALHVTYFFLLSFFLSLSLFFFIVTLVILLQFILLSCIINVIIINPTSSRTHPQITLNISLLHPCHTHASPQPHHSTSLLNHHYLTTFFTSSFLFCVSFLPHIMSFHLPPPCLN